MKKILLIFISAVIALAACQKMNTTSGIDIEKYESQLNTDYSNASINHDALTAVSSDSHLAHHSATSLNSSPDQLLLFSRNDSLFSEHFFEFCIDMMKNEEHMTSGGMMGNSGMMGETGNMDEMMKFMESAHNSQTEMMNPDYFKTDSIMYLKMSECNMMDKGTEGISSIFYKMQALRINHRSMLTNY